MTLSEEVVEDAALQLRSVARYRICYSSFGRLSGCLNLGISFRRRAVSSNCITVITVAAFVGAKSLHFSEAENSALVLDYSHLVLFSRTRHRVSTLQPRFDYRFELC